MKSKNELVQRDRGTAKGVGIVIGAPLAIFGGLYLILPPSFVLPAGASIAGLIAAVFAIRSRRAAWQTAFLSLGLTVVLLFVLILLITRPTSTGTGTADLLALELDRLLQSKSFSGAVLIARDDHILLNQGYGYADRSRLIANTSQTRFRLGSVSKQFTAMAILMLQARGQLNVQDRICLYLADCPTAWTAITIHQLLTHSSGMADYVALCFSSADEVQQMIVKARNQPLAFEPGTRYAYSNVGYRVLAEIIEQVSGERYGQFLQKNIFIPLGMASTAFETTDTPGLAVGYTNRFLPACPMDMAFEYGEGGINSTVEDLYRWDRALNAEPLIPRSLLQSMFTAHIPVEDQMGITGGAGYGWGVGQQLGHRMQVHGGFIQGFTSAIARFPDDRMTMIILSNQQNYDESIYRLLVGALLSRE